MTSSRFAWGITLATVAFWTVTALGGPGDRSPRSASAADSGRQHGTGISDAVETGASMTMSIDDDATLQLPSCDSPEPAAQAPVAEVPSAPPATASISPSGLEGTFRLCGPPDPASERAIEGLIAGRGFSATLVGGRDGCAELTLTVSPQSSTQGRNSTSLSVSGLSVQIVSENGVTRATIGGRR